jgi:DNA-binding NtrC family response regulator
VRQLENVIERAFALGHGPAIGPEDLPPEIRHGSRPAASAEGPLPATCTLEEGERAVILRALEEAGGNKVKAARLLGIKRKRLYRLLHKHGLMPDNPKS